MGRRAAAIRRLKNEASGRVEDDVHALQTLFAKKSLRETDTDATSRSTSTSHGRRRAWLAHPTYFCEMK